MSERKYWKAEEKLALINEIKERGHVVKTYRKYGADPTTFYRWKESSDIFGIESLRSRSWSIEACLRKLKRENERLKKIIAEKELEVSLLLDTDKKNEGKALLSEYIARGPRTSSILVLLKTPRSTYYHSPPSLQLKRGGERSSDTTKLTPSGITAVTMDMLLGEIMDILSKEFVCYGNKKICKHLQRSGCQINKKRVFRVLKENHLLNHTYTYRSPAKRVVESIVRVHTHNEVWESDLEYIYIRGENWTAYLFAIIDCFMREVVRKYLVSHRTSKDVKRAMDFAFLDREIEVTSGIRIRSDDGTQLVSRAVELFPSSLGIEHERIHPATPKENAHIESSNSILAKEVISRFEFSSFGDADSTIEEFYSAIDYRAPR